ncbi:MAG TPA: FG-GAP repeat protein [Ferruginibacter sp.]|nr:FG-GAP repeat protein [Ferruginibacter sp.]
MKKIFLLYVICLLVWISNSYSQSIGIGTTTPNSSAILDVQSANKGMLVPRIALTALNTASPVSSPADALLVYNTATAGVGDNAVVPGFYYWTAAGNAWKAVSSKETVADVGFGGWGECSGGNVSEYNPVAEENSQKLGASVAVSGNFAIIGDHNDGTGGSASFYRFNGTNWVFMQKVTDATGGIGDWFGVSVSISGNYAIVGAYYNDNGLFNNNNNGAAIIFQYNGSSWVLMQKIIPVTSGIEHYYGVDVSISGNYAVIGGYGADVGGGPFQGAARIYQYNGSSWVFMQQITDPTGTGGDRFGGSVSISGNFIIAGSMYDDLGTYTDAGSATIYQYNGSSWVFMQKLYNFNGLTEDAFGASVSISGNYAVVGAPFDDEGANTDQGSVNMYKFNGTSWVWTQKITDPNGVASDRFGSQVSISGNYALVGTVSDGIGPNAYQGSATLYTKVGGGWQRLQYLTDPGGGPAEFFGKAVDIDGTSKRFLISSEGSTGQGKVVFGKVN